MSRYRHHSKIIAAALALAVTGPMLVPVAAADKLRGAVPISLFSANRQPELQVGDRLDTEHLHTVSRPGLYGIGSPPDGSRYGIIAGKLIRYDPQDSRLLSIIREVDEILD